MPSTVDWLHHYHVPEGYSQYFAYLERKKREEEDAAKAKKKCLGLADASQSLCNSNAYTANSKEILGCAKIIFYTPAMEQCNKAAEAYLKGALENCSFQFKTDSLRCE